MSANPPTTGRDQFLATVAANVSLCREHYRLVLSLAQFPETQAGQFVQLACRDVSDASEMNEIEWCADAPPTLRSAEVSAPGAMLRRPFSLAGRRDTGGGVELDIIHRVVGVGTEWLSGLRAGEAVSVLGPLGNRFTLPAVEQAALLVGGGVGIPPMLYLAEALSGRKAVAFCGALSRDLLPLTIEEEPDAQGRPTTSIGEFSRHGIPSVVTTDDGSAGMGGYVTQALERYLDTRPVSWALNPLVYTCGPEPMMKRVADIAAARGIDCQIAVERAMACGMGTCQSCCIRVLKPDPSQPPLPGSAWCYRLACTDGPVFHGRELLW